MRYERMRVAAWGVEGDRAVVNLEEQECEPRVNSVLSSWVQHREWAWASCPCSMLHVLVSGD